MIVKGHDFPDVTLVGVIAADLSLNMDDYHCGERTFQLLTQAVGRSGRGNKAGHAVIQTYQPEHYSIQAAAIQDYEKFYKEAFEVFAFNYLTKPVESGELEHVLLPILTTCEREGGKALHFHYRTQVYTLQHNSLAYISSSLHNVTFHLTDGKKLSCRARLGDFAGQLSDSNFMRCHQSFCINLEKVNTLKKNSFVIGQTEIPISRAYLKTARKKYKDYLAEQKVCS